MSNISPVRKQIVVDAPQERAFRVFTEGLDRWWPREYKIGKAPMAKAILEERAGGRWYEKGDDGSECEWGRVLTWEPPRKLVLAWQVSAQWQFDPGLVSEVEVTFTAQGPTQTLVELEHRNFEGYGDAAAATRDLMNQGWLGIMEGYKAVVAGQAPQPQSQC